ncbi:MAG: biotin--[acetyl-CoA-carboxylase] ligase [Burkholderiaceae bacterium]|nr:biotin--[acetyl-CoA-carboxylase] ligase [Burkholderiaceae bacterium]MCD8517900.1 biotin--[acetyl-CoA-carboxylase] ligase [Burkholderiaceae bacterium]MCD8536518.1 biotin--[acetyl-CoA-carboxylase] ligase [Burkholderiaceae bacterium]MCD8565360.1 biotin--[acetyl-CoA-carboxylase] ligase [Burkholderiaceae bacterium]
MAKLPEFAAIQWAEQTDSTNARLVALARESGIKAKWPQLFGTHHQTQGKGRLGRIWHDRPGQALMFSAGFALQNKGTPAKLDGLGPAIGMASTIALRQFLAQPTRLRVKWPNDLMLDQGKCAGILIELASTVDTTFIVIGMGINLSGHTQLQTKLAREVADLGPEFLPHAAASDLVAALARSWQQTLEKVKRLGFTSCQADYASVDYLANQAVNIIDQGVTITTGIASGLAPDGGLQVKTSKGLETFFAGDVSVRINTDA